MSYFWCLLFHKSYRKRTGERRIMRVSIVYEIHCEKCGNDDEERVWLFI